MIFSTTLTEQQLQQDRIDAIDRDVNRIRKEEIRQCINNDKKKSEVILKIAERLEEKYSIQSHNFLINTISTEVARYFKIEGDPNYYHVPDYLPDKYKNPRISQAAKNRVEQAKAEIEQFSSSSSQTVGQSQTNQLEQIKAQFEGLIKEIPTEQIRDFWELAGHLKEEIADKAEEAGVPLLSEGGYGSQTPDDDRKVSTVEPPETDAEVDKIIEELRKDYHTTGDETFDEFKRFWPQHKDKVSRWAEGIKAVMSIFKWLNDDKFSQDVAEWFDRAGYTGGETEGGHGKHAGAVWRKALTCLCRKCSADVLNDENEYEVMFIDPTSPTGWRCPRCHGHDQMERAMTREQIGDRREYIFGFANYLLQKIPGFLDLCDWYRNYKKPYNTARKIRLFRKLSDLA